MKTRSASLQFNSRGRQETEGGIMRSTTSALMVGGRVYVLGSQSRSKTSVVGLMKYEKDKRFLRNRLHAYLCERSFFCIETS